MKKFIEKSLIQSMIKDSFKQDKIFLAGNYWKKYEKKILKQIKENKLEEFRSWPGGAGRGNIQSFGGGDLAYSSKFGRNFHPLEKSFQKFQSLDFPLEILRGSKIGPVGFLKENQDFEIFEHFFSKCWLTLDIGYKDKPLKIHNIVSLKMAHLKYFCNQMSGTYSSRQGIPPPLKRLVKAVGLKSEKTQS